MLVLPQPPSIYSVKEQAHGQTEDLSLLNPPHTHTHVSVMVIQVYAPTSNAEEAEVEQFYEDLQDLLELTSKRDVLFTIGDWNAKVGSQETPGVTGKFWPGNAE